MVELKRDGYKAKLISTIVDRSTPNLKSNTAIKPN